MVLKLIQWQRTTQPRIYITRNLTLHDADVMAKFGLNIHTILADNPEPGDNLKNHRKE